MIPMGASTLQAVTDAHLAAFEELAHEEAYDDIDILPLDHFGPAMPHISDAEARSRNIGRRPSERQPPPTHPAYFREKYPCVQVVGSLSDDTSATSTDGIGRQRDAR